MSNKLNLFVLLAIILVSTVVNSQNLLDQPESVAFDSANNRYLVNNIGDGKVIAVDTACNQSEFLTGLGICYGNCIKNDTFYVSAGNTIWGIDLITNDTTMLMMVSPLNAIDGLTTDTSGYLYGVDTGGRILKINIATQTYSVFVGTGNLVAGIQDIYFDIRHNRLIAVGWIPNSIVQGINLIDSTVDQLTVSTYGHFDGVTMDEFGNTYMASYSNGGQVICYDSNFTEPPEIISTGHTEPSGLDYNSTYHMIAVPNFGANRLDFVNALIDIEADTTIGWVPFDVQFTGISRVETVDSWTWDFGDGQGESEQSPSHIFTQRGMFDISLSIDSEGETISYGKKNYVIALADTIMASEVRGDPGETVEVVISAVNTVPLNKIRIPVEYLGLLGLTLDSYTLEGCRTEHFDNLDKTSSDIAFKTATFVISNDYGSATPNLDPGEGPIMKLYFTISPIAQFGHNNPIHIDGYSSQVLKFESSYLFYEPVNLSGNVALTGICGDADGNGLVNILDITYLISYLYKDGPSPEPLEITDADGNGLVNILDITYLISFLYKSGPAPVC